MGAADGHTSRRRAQQQKMRTAPAIRNDTLRLQAGQAGDARHQQTFLCEFQDIACGTCVRRPNKRDRARHCGCGVFGDAAGRLPRGRFGPQAVTCCVPGCRLNKTERRAIANAAFPTMLLVGRHDPVAPPSWVQKAAASLRATLTITGTPLPDDSHAVSIRLARRRRRAG